MLRVLSLEPSPSYGHLGVLKVHVDVGAAGIDLLAVALQYSAIGYGSGN